MSKRCALALAALLLLGAVLPTAETYSQDADADFWQALVAGQGLTSEQERKYFAALEVLMPLHRTIMRQHLRSITFVEGLPANAQTMRVDNDGAELDFRVFINARVLEETLSEFATRKERQLFEPRDSQLTVTVVAGSMDALAFVLLHEATHMADMALGFTPAVAPGARIEEVDQPPFAREIWETPVTPVAAYRGEALDSMFWRTGKPLDMASARTLYEDLERTPFASVYASLASVEDIAELVAWWQMTEIHGQPYRIEVRDQGELVYAYEPMKSSLVRSRLDQLDRFDSPE